MRENGYDVLSRAWGRRGALSRTTWRAAARGSWGWTPGRPPHVHGSTHGESRIIREAYYEGP